MSGFLKLQRSEEGQQLAASKPWAFILLYFIACRARRFPDPHHTPPLEAGEALIGDWKNMGLSRQQYRDALDHLKGTNKVTIKGTTKGTIAKILDTSIYDINPIDENHQDSHQRNHRGTIEEPSRNHRGTTNKKERSKEGEERKKEESCPSVPSDPSVPASKNNPLLEFEAGWSEAYHRTTTYAYVPNWGPDRKMIQPLLAVVPVAEILRVAERAWKLRNHPKAFHVLKAMAVKTFAPAWNEIRAEVELLDSNGHVAQTPATDPLKAEKDRLRNQWNMAGSREERELIKKRFYEIDKQGPATAQP